MSTTESRVRLYHCAMCHALGGESDDAGLCENVKSHVLRAIYHVLVKFESRQYPWVVYVRSINFVQHNRRHRMKVNREQ